MNMQGSGTGQSTSRSSLAGLGPLVDRVTKLGMGFGLWVEPEMVNPDSDLYRAHPEWAYHFANRSRTESRNQLVLNLAREDVADWVFATVDRLLSEQDISFIKWDMNRPFSEPGWPEKVGSNPERALGRPCPQPLRHLGPPASGPPASRVRVMFGRWRPGRHRDPFAHRAVLDLRQHRRLGPHCDARRFFLCARSHGDGGLGN